MLDTACEFLSPDLRPIPPQPNCAQSMQIYEEHRQVNSIWDSSKYYPNRKSDQMAAEYLRQQSEIAELREYKAKIADKIQENQEIIDSKTPTAEDMKHYNRLKDEKVGLQQRLDIILTLLE